MRQTLSVAICVIVSLVLGAICTRYVHPTWLLAILHSLQFHAAVACVAGLLVALVIRRHWVILVLLAIAVAVTLQTVYLEYRIASPATAADAGAPTFRLMSFNILDGNFENGEAIAKAIDASGADVVNVMEASPVLNFLPEISETYPYRVGCGVMIEDCDQLMLSKTPLINASVRTLSGIFENRFILADVDIRSHRITVGGIHTTKPYFDNFHQLELTHAALAITDIDAPFILSGDFNASSLAPDMQRFLDWTHLTTVGFEPPTWPVRAGVLGVAIDHVYARAPLKIISVHSLPDALGSNHNGLIADIAITGQ